MTSVDGRIARIYPISIWKQNEIALEVLARENPAAADAILFISSDFGAEAKVDPQGRITLPTDLRRSLSLESQEVRLNCTMGVINIYSSAEYESRKRVANEGLPGNLDQAKMKGFK